MTLTPAYGRDYKSKKAVLADWNGNKDFVIADCMHPNCGRYANKEQLDGQRIMLRYDNLRKVIAAK